MKPTAEKVLSVLVELYAKQNGVRIEYIIDSPNNSEPNKAAQITEGLGHSLREYKNERK